MKKTTTKTRTKKEQIIFLVKNQKLDSYESIAMALNCKVKTVIDYVWCIQFRDGVWLGF